MKSTKNLAVHLALASTLCAGTLLLGSAPALAMPGWSWNLSRDMMIDFAAPASNPIGTWTFMESAAQCSLATPLTQFGGPGACWGASWSTDTSCWYDPAAGVLGSAMVGLPTVPVGWPHFHQGVPIMHPGMGTSAIVRWTNPYPQWLKVQVLGRFTSVNPYGSGIADGVDWSVQDSKCSILASSCGLGGGQAAGTIDSTNIFPPEETGVFDFVAGVGPGDSLDFIVERRGNYYYDGTELDVLIVGL